MVRCKFNGVTWDTNEGKNLSFVYIDDRENDDCYDEEGKLNLVFLGSKVIEDEWDEKGRPRVKYVYMDAGDWNNRLQGLVFDDIDVLKARELQNSYCLKVDGKPFEFPRLIFVLQDRDYWPGSESDPLVLKRRLWKDAAYLEKTKSGELSFPRPDRKVIPCCYQGGLIYGGNEYDANDFSEYGKAKRLFDHIYNPKLPGSKFVYDNLSEQQRNELEEVNALLFGRLDIGNKLEERSFSGETKRLESSNNDIHIEELEDFWGSDPSNNDIEMEEMEDFHGKMVEEGEVDADEKKSRSDGKMEECEVDFGCGAWVMVCK